jgi:hypothetical protein
MTIGGAWEVYDRWLREPKVEIQDEPLFLADLFRRSTQPFLKSASPKVLGDCYLLALAQASDSVLVTFDGALSALAAKMKSPATLLS